MGETALPFLIALLFGLPLGAMLPSRWEKKARPARGQWVPFGSGRPMVVRLLTLLVKVPLVVGVFAGLLYLATLTLPWVGVASLSNDEWGAFRLVYLCGIGLGKMLRYFWWRRRLQGQVIL
jgi:hypothetical protein